MAEWRADRGPCPTRCRRANCCPWGGRRRKAGRRVPVEARAVATTVVVRPEEGEESDPVAKASAWAVEWAALGTAGMAVEIAHEPLCEPTLRR